MRFSPKNNATVPLASKRDGRATGGVPDGWWRAVADSDLNLQVFNVERNSDGLWLNTNYEDADNRYDADTVRVWSRRPPVSAPAA
ncbi:MAG: hypothetical protein WCO25_04450, partial [Candidatus Uhrbacteria bacterium]